MGHAGLAGGPSPGVGRPARPVDRIPSGGAAVPGRGPRGGDLRQRRPGPPGRHPHRLATRRELPRGGHVRRGARQGVGLLVVVAGRFPPDPNVGGRRADVAVVVGAVVSTSSLGLRLAVAPGARRRPAACRSGFRRRAGRVRRRTRPPASRPRKRSPAAGSRPSARRCRFPRPRSWQFRGPMLGDLPVEQTRWMIAGPASLARARWKTWRVGNGDGGRAEGEKRRRSRTAQPPAGRRGVVAWRRWRIRGG